VKFMDERECLRLVGIPDNRIASVGKVFGDIF
jgi:hypothetical protein